MPIPEKVTKIVCGYRHNLAITEFGRLYGWGFNNQMQLSNSDKFSDPETPHHAFFTPTLIYKGLEDKFVLNAAAGEEFSVVHCKNAKNVQELYAFGSNLRGQLGINRLSEINDITMIDDLSGFVDKQNNAPLNISNVSCGRRHCIATFDYGSFFIWGDNEFGQLGDRKRRYLESPRPKSKFELKHNVENVICGVNSCAVIVEDLEDRRSK